MKNFSPKYLGDFSFHKTLEKKVFKFWNGTIASEKLKTLSNQQYAANETIFYDVLLIDLLVQNCGIPNLNKALYDTSDFF